MAFAIHMWHTAHVACSTGLPVLLLLLREAAWGEPRRVSPSSRTSAGLMGDSGREKSGCTVMRLKLGWITQQEEIDPTIMLKTLKTTIPVRCSFYSCLWRRVWCLCCGSALHISGLHFSIRQFGQDVDVIFLAASVKEVLFHFICFFSHFSFTYTSHCKFLNI